MQDLTKGPIVRNVLSMTSFMLISMVFQTLYFLVDLYFVGRLGMDAVAAVSVSGNLTFIVLAASQMLAVGTTALIAHATGRKDRAEARLVFNQSQVMALLVGALFLLVMTALRGWYAGSLTASASTARLAEEYLVWFIPAMALQFAMVASSAALRGTGNFKPGMLVQSGSVLLNMALAPLLILGIGTGRPLGVAGAAIASLISVAAAVLALTLYLLRAEAYLQFASSEWRPRPDLWWRMLKIGLPAGAEFALMGFYLMVIYVLARPFGTAAQAGFGIGLRVIQGLFLPVVALGFAVSPVAGQNFGARLADRVRETFRVSAAMATGLMVLFTLLCHLVPAAMIGVFSSDPQVVAVGAEYLRIVSWNYVASGLVFVGASMFQAMGNTFPSLISSLLRVVLLVVPAYLLSSRPDFELRWIWYLSVASVLVQAGCVLLFLRLEFRRKLAFGL